MDDDAARPLLIGFSARIHHPAEGAAAGLGGVWTKTLHYLEQAAAHWVMHAGALAVMVPALGAENAGERAEIHLDHYAAALDGLVLQGGSDVAPETYGETPIDPRWHGDRVRDRYEIELVRAFVDAGKPVFGICRGLQLLNVAFGGTLWQDIATQKSDAQPHRELAKYEHHFHTIEIVPGTHLARLYPGVSGGVTNSIHHQGIKALAPGFTVEARCPEDGLAEAIRRDGPGYVAGVQWHPEFHRTTAHAGFDDTPLLDDFLRAARSARAVRRNA